MFERFRESPDDSPGGQRVPYVGDRMLETRKVSNIDATWFINGLNLAVMITATILILSGTTGTQL